MNTVFMGSLQYKHDKFVYFFLIFTSRNQMTMYDRHEKCYTLKITIYP